MEKKDCLKHVVFVLPSLTAGGAERVLINLMLSLDKAIYRTTLITCMDKHGLEHLIPESVLHIRLKARGIMWSILPLSITLRQLKPNVVISTMTHMNFITLLCTPAKAPVIVREAILPSFNFKAHPFLARYLKAGYKFLYPMAFMVLSPSKLIENELSALQGQQKWTKKILLNFIDLNKIREEIEHEKTKDEFEESNIFQFVASGRLHPQKGFERLIKALATSSLSYEWVLKIYGEGSERQTLQKIIKDLGMEKKIFLCGHIKTPWVKYACADIFLLPSLSEGLPNVVLESLACGTPVLAMAEAGGISEIAHNAKKGDVTVVNTMPEFIEHLSTLSGRHKTAIKESLLPSCYFKAEITQKFEQILETVVSDGL